MNYDPSSGRSLHARTTLTPENAVRVIEWARLANLSVSGVMAALVENTPTDPETGLPACLALAEPDLFHQEAS